MTDQDTVVDSPVDWIAEHIRDYVSSDGAVGHVWNDMTTLLLQTRGRKSGQWRRTALIYGLDSGRYVVVASNSGRSHHPLWYLNLSVHPQVRLQVGGEHLTATARTATAAEKPALWAAMLGVFPPYEEFQRRTEREIPVVILEPTPAQATPPAADATHPTS